MGEEAAMIDKKLKDCPFCGSNEIDSRGWLDGQGKAGPQCMNCGATAESALRWEVRADLAPQWRPIETAPKDGTRILVFRKKETGYENQIIGIDYWNSPGWMKSRLRMPPTHWMPLPSPPEDA